MMHWSGGMGGWGMLFMTVSNLLVWGLLVAGIVVLVRHVGRSSRSEAPAPGLTAPRQILAERFARGEIDAEEYGRRVAVLTDATPT